MTIFYRCFLLIVLCLLGGDVFAGVDPVLKRGIDLAYNAQFQEAENILNAYVAGHLGDPRGYIVRGIAKDWKQKVYHLKEQLDPQILADFETANKLAFLQWEKDEEDIDKMVTLGNSYLFLAKKWLDMGRKSRAGLILKKCQKHMEKAVGKDPSRYDAYLAMGIFNFYAANVPPGLGFLMSILGISGDEAKGLTQLQEAASHPNLHQADALFVLAYANAMTKQKYLAALGPMGQLVSRYPNNPYFKHLKGEYLMRTKQYEKSRQAFQDYFSFCQSKPQGFCASTYLFLSHYYLAVSYVRDHNVMAAKPHLEMVGKLDENEYPERSAALHYYVGLVLKAEGKKEQASKEFKQAISSPGVNSETKKKANLELTNL